MLLGIRTIRSTGETLHWASVSHSYSYTVHIPEDYCIVAKVCCIVYVTANVELAIYNGLDIRVAQIRHNLLLWSVAAADPMVRSRSRRLPFNYGS